MKRRRGDFWRYIACAALLLAVVVVFEARLAQWQLVQGESFDELSLEGSFATVKLAAARGEILLTDGSVLAGNHTVYNVVINNVGSGSEQLNETVRNMIALLEARGEEWIDELPIERVGGSYVFKEDMEADIAYMKGRYMLNMQSYATAQDCMDYMTQLYDCEDIEDETLRRKVISVRYYMHKTGFSRSTPYVMAEDVSEDTVAAVSEASRQLPGVTVEVATRRYYENGDLAPHIVGELFAITQEQYDNLSEEERYSSDNVSGYAYTDRLGQSGIESAFEDDLRGENGKRLVYTDSQGLVTGSEVVEAPVAGNTVYLTLDAALQRVANRSLALNVEAARQNGLALQQQAVLANAEEQDGFGEDCTAGAVVVLSVDDFAVLAAATYPSYDLELYDSDVDYLRALYQDENDPMFNRAFDGSFMPGSVFKPCLAAAALEEKVIDIDSTVRCEGIYTYYDDYQPRCMGTHGDISVEQALARSCNIFFYDTGRRLGIERMTAYANLFGLGVETGLELSEGTGLMSSPAEYEEYHDAVWTDGLTLQASIGQLDDAFTPLQLATYCATIANDGVRMETHLMEKITDYTRRTVVRTHEPTVAADTRISQSTLQIVHEGMRRVVTNGTASSRFGDYGVAIAAKTGTAEVPGHSDNVTFIAYAPYDDPQIAIAVVLQYGDSSVYSLNVAEDILDAYFFGKTVDENGNLVMPERVPASSAAADNAPAVPVTAALLAAGGTRRSRRRRSRV